MILQTVLLLVYLSTNILLGQDYPIELKGPYLGQKSPGLTSDGKYFFFLDNRDYVNQPYWVDAKIIEELKPEGLK